MLAKELYKGTLKTIILKQLDDRGEMYGYEITQYVKQLSEGRLLLTEGALYPTLHKLEKEGLVAFQQRFVGNRTRKYYRITKKGRQSLKVKLFDFQEFMYTMQLILHIKTQS